MTGLLAGPDQAEVQGEAAASRSCQGSLDGTALGSDGASVWPGGHRGDRRQGCAAVKVRRRFYSRRDRWPTIRGENPPAGLPMRRVGFMHPRLSIEIRLWSWR